MPAGSLARAPETTPRRVADDGFTLIEVLVAMGIFTVMVTVALGIVLKTTALTASSSHRVVASALAGRQIESARSLKAVQIPDGATVRTETVDGVPYRVTQTANYLPADATSSVCTGSGSQLAYKLVTVTVTWPNMGAIPAVRADTLRAIGIGEGLDTGTGSLALAVVDATGAPVSGATVAVAPSAQVTTGIDGCAVLTGLAPATYAATATATGYVGSNNAASATLANLSVSAGGISRGTILFDRARSVVLTASGTPDYVAPTGLALTLRDTYLGQLAYPPCSGVTGQGCVNGLPGTAASLFPAVYNVWAGTCADAAAAPTTVDLTGVDSAAAPAAAGIGIGHVIVDVQTAGVSQPGRVVYAVHAHDPVSTPGGCAGGESYALPPTGAGGSRVVLPYGAWTFSLTPVPPPGAPTATLTSAGAASVVVVAP